jgi:hypothetical protein
MKAHWVGHILRRICLLKHVTEGKIKKREVRGRRERRRKQLMCDLKERRWYWKLKEKALGDPRCTTHFGPVVRQCTDCNMLVPEYLGYAVALLVEALRYKPEGHGFDSQCCHWNFSLTIRTVTLGLTQPLTEMSTRNISWW